MSSTASDIKYIPTYTASPSNPERMRKMGQYSVHNGNNNNNNNNSNSHRNKANNYSIAHHNNARSGDPYKKTYSDFNFNTSNYPSSAAAMPPTRTSYSYDNSNCKQDDEDPNSSRLLHPSINLSSSTAPKYTNDPFAIQSPDPDRSPNSWKQALARRLINYRCSDQTIFSISLVVGVMVLFVQSVSLCTDGWVAIIEPKVVYLKKLEDDVGADKEKKELLFYRFESGYWRVCREPYQPPNWNFSKPLMEMIQNETVLCFKIDHFPQVINPADAAALTTELPPLNDAGREFDLDLAALSVALPDILARINFCILAHMVSMLLSLTAFVLSTAGYLKLDRRTLLGAVTYIVSGLTMCVSVMQFICVVDDEMAPRQRATSEGEPSHFSYKYGWSMFSGMASFLGLQACAIANIMLFLRRYPGVEGKLMLVPGLRERISKMDAGKVNNAADPVEDSPGACHKDSIYEKRRSSSFVVPTPGAIMYFTDTV